MPYIKSDRRDELAVGNYPKTAGELNYEVTQKIIEYLVTHDLGYQTINDVVGALEGAKLEFYRRVVGILTKIARSKKIATYILRSSHDIPD